MTDSTQRRRERRDKRREDIEKWVSDDSNSCRNWNDFFLRARRSLCAPSVLARESCSFQLPCFWFSLRLSLRSLRLCVEPVFLFGTGFPSMGGKPLEDPCHA